MSLRAGAPAQPPAPLPAQLRATLPGHYYTDPEQLTGDQEAVSARSWLCVARSDEVIAPGSFLRASAAGRDVIVVRGRDGVLRGFHNLCRHRGAALCLEPQGQFRRAIRCMYHAWTYDLDGRLVAAPNAHEMPDLPKEQLGCCASAWRSGWAPSGSTWTPAAPLARAGGPAGPGAPGRPGHPRPLRHRLSPARPPHRVRRGVEGSAWSRTPWSATTARASIPS